MTEKNNLIAGARCKLFMKIKKCKKWILLAYGLSCSKCMVK